MNNVHKGIAIPYIIALVIGLLVLAFIFYWIYRTTNPSYLSLQECKSRYITWCTSCAQMKWPGFHCMPLGVLECKEILRNAGFKVPEGTSCSPKQYIEVADCTYEDVKKDCAALGVCLNNPAC